MIQRRFDIRLLLSPLHFQVQRFKVFENAETIITFLKGISDL